MPEIATLRRALLIAAVACLAPGVSRRPEED